MEIKSWLKNVGVGMVKNGCGQSGHKTLKLAVSQEGVNEKNLFFACWYNSVKLKVTIIIFGWAWSEMSMAF